MINLNDVEQEIKNDTTRIGEKAPKIRTLSDVVNSSSFTANDFNEDFNKLVPEFESDLNVRLRAGFDRGIQDLKNIPEQLEIYGGQALMSIGGFIDSGETVSMGRELIKSAFGELQADEKKYWESAIELSDKDKESFGYGLGQGIANYGAMLAVGYVSPIAGIGLGTALEVGQKAEEKIGYHIDETGDSELNKYTSQKAQKDTLFTTIYGVGSAIIEKKFGLGEQLKMVKMPITSKLKHVVKTMVSEGGTETLQELFATGLDWQGGYIDSSKLPERFMGALKEGAIGAVLGGGMGVASAINHRSQAKAILREQLKNAVPEKDLDNVVDGIYESANDSMSTVVAQELVQSESLRNKHGALYNQILQEINKQIEDVGAFSQYTEAQKSQYAVAKAKEFADWVLGEANKRGVVIDEVVKASEIVYKDGKLYPQGASKKTKLKRLKEKTPSLLQFIRSKGGVIDEGGELKMMDASKQYIGLVNKNGVDLDTMGEALWEAGYFTERPTVAELLDLIDSELRGTKHYPLGYVEQKGVSQAENEAMLDNAISEYAEVMEYDISKMSFEEKQQIYEQMQRNLYASEEPIVEGEEVVEDFGFTDNEFFQFAGEKAKTALLNKLSEAKDLKSQGVDNEEIRQQTGWFLGADDKWRFEISDKDAEFIENPKLNRTIEDGSVVWRATLKDILKHDKLYQAYPQIADIEIMMTSSDASLKGVTIEDKIGLNTRLLNTPKEAIKTLMHEVQHIIQSIEGFSSGGSSSADFIKEIKKHLKISAEASRDSERLEYFEKKLGSKQKAKDLLQKEWIANKALQKSFDEMGDISPEAEKTNDEYLKLVEEYGLTSEEMRESWNTPSLKKYNLLSSMSDGEVYERIYGEIEARNTANRLDFSEEQRKQTPIEETQLDRAGKNKITNEEAVIVFDGVDVYSFEERPNKVYSVFDLKVGDSLKAFGVVEEINQTDRQIKIGGQWHSMFMLDMEANRFGLTLGNKEEIDISEDVEEEVKKVSDDRSAVEEKKANNAEYNKITEDYFGITNNLDLGGYILTDGNLLDLSGKKLGSDGKTRAVDHREVSDAFEDYGVSMEDFINSGNIRYMPESNSILMSDVPNSKQYKIIEKIINRANGQVNVELMSDANNWGSFNDYSREYPSGTSLSAIKRDINAFYKGEGVRPVTKYYQVTNLPKQEKKIKGSFDALTKSIKITSEADFSTYSHEFAHFFLDNIWNYVNSGMASEKYIKEFEGIKKWLGVKGNYPTRSQHEKFARAYEKYLYKGTNADAPIGQAFKDYENFIREVYSSIAEIDTRAGLKYRAVPKLVYDFFDSMTSGTLHFYGDIEEPEKEVKKEVKEVKEFVAEETKILEENRANYSLKPVQTDTKTGYLTAYEKMTSEKVEAGSIELKEQIEKAQKFVSENQEQAKRIVEGLEPAPDGMLKNTIYIAYNELQKRLGNTQNRVTSLLNQAMELRRMGQEIVSQKIAYADDTSPLYWIRTVQQNKVEALADASGLKVSELSEKINSSIKAGIKEGKSAKDIAKELRNELGVTELYQTEVYPTTETDVASYNYIYKYVNEQLGLSMSMAEAETITRKADDMLASLENSKAKNGNPSVDFFVKQKDLENYANSLAPSSRARVLVSVIGRGNLLTSIKSPFTNIENNIVVGILRAITRRIKLQVGKSIVSPELIAENKQYSYEIWKKTGYNVNNITPETPRNTILGEKITHSEGKGTIRWFGKLYEEYVYKWGLGWGDVKSKDFAFTDYVALKATKLAKGDVNKANAIFKDACLIDPQTDEGKEIRQEAIQESLIATYQNKGLLSESLLKYREGLSFGVGFGEFLVPFVKTPANVKSMELKTGFGLLKAIPHEIIKDVKAVYRIKKENPNKSLAELMKTEDFKKAIKPLEKNIELVTQNSLGLAIAWAIASALDDDDYMPSYAFASSKDKQLAKELNIPFNAIRIGDTWISLDYFGALASPLVGWLQARREESFFAYLKTAGVQVASLPGLGNIADLYQKVEGLAKKSKDEVVSETGDALMEQLYVRSIPAIFSDIAKALDSYERETKGDEIITKIPFARERAFEKISVTSGKAEELGNPIYDILFGSRVKEQVSNDVADELQRLNNAGWGVSLTTVTRSGLLSELDDNTKQKVREDFAEEYSKQVKRLIKTPRYKRLSDEDKQESINKIRRSIVERLKKRYLKKRKK